MDPSLLDRYVAGQATAGESRLVEAWIEAHPAHRSQVEALRDMRRALRDHGARYDGGLAVAVLRERMRETPVLALERRRRRPVRVALAALAAALVVGVGLSVAVVQSRDQQYATGPEGRMTITLADGSRVALAPASTLRVSRSHRDVELSGEAYFVVRHDPTHPLTVRTSQGAIQDVGTEFDVRAVAGLPLRVAVVVGAVTVRGAPVAAGQVATLDAAGQVARTRGRIVVRDATVAEAARVIQQWTDTRLVVDSGLAGRHVTVSFDRETAEDALRIVAKLIDARVVTGAGTLRLVPK
jgi:transmembrane sensor